MFSFEDGSEMESVPDASEFLESALNIWDDYSEDKTMNNVLKHNT
jgi:hypothetical protein